MVKDRAELLYEFGLPVFAENGGVHGSRIFDAAGSDIVHQVAQAVEAQLDPGALPLRHSRQGVGDCGATAKENRGLSSRGSEQPAGSLLMAQRRQIWYHFLAGGRGGAAVKSSGPPSSVARGFATHSSSAAWRP